jgi:hypothetical protein
VIGSFDIVIGLDEPRRLARKATEDVAIEEAKRELSAARLGTVISVFPHGTSSGRVFIRTVGGVHEVRRSTLEVS